FGKPGEVKVWDAQTGKELLALKGHTDPVHIVAFSADGKRLASASSVWDAQKQEHVSWEVKVWDVSMSTEGRQAGSTKGQQAGGQLLLDLKGRTGFVWGVAFSPDGKRVIAAGIEGGVRAWDAQTGQ